MTVEGSILLVEDDEVDVMAVQRLLRRLGLTNPLRLARDGEAALALLRGEGEQAPLRPILVLLDLKMPRMGGTELLQELDADAVLRGIPVVVLSGSDQPSDMEACRELGAQSYLIKPLTLEALLKTTAKLGLHWTLRQRL
jgi:CheY-like chemotaxis protein